MSQTASLSCVQGLDLDPNEIGFYRREGYLYLPGLIDQQTAEAARSETLEVLRIVKNLSTQASRGQEGQPQRLIQSTQYLSGSVLDRIINSPELNHIVTQLLGGASSLYLPFTAVKTGGGGEKFSFHQDNQYTRFTGGLLGINVWFALCPMTPENGCLQMCPRSQLRGTLDAEKDDAGWQRTRIEPADFLPMRMRPGDAVAFSRLTVHGSGVNKTDQPRVAYAVQFHRDDATAIWDNQPPRPLRGANRWTVGPVERIVAEAAATRDGH